MMRPATLFYNHMSSVTYSVFDAAVAIHLITDEAVEQSRAKQPCHDHAHLLGIVCNAEHGTLRGDPI